MHVFSKISFNLPTQKLPDMFAKEITLMCEEKTNFKTLCGFACTITVITFLTVLASFEIFKLLRQDISNLTYFETSRLKYPVAENNPLLPSAIQFWIETENNNLIIGHHITFEGSNNSSIRESDCQIESSNKKCFVIETADLDSQQELFLFIKKCEDKECQKNLMNIAKRGILKLNLFIESNNNQISNNYEDTVITKMKKIESNLNLNFEKVNVLNLIEIESSTQSGLMYSSTRFRSLRFSSFSESLLTLETGLLLTTIKITVDQERKEVVEKYRYNLKDVVSYLGGLLKGITLLAFILVWPFSEVFFYNFLVNEMFAVCDSPSVLKKCMDNHNSRNSDKTKENDNIITEVIERIEKLKNRIKQEGLFSKILKNEEHLKETVIYSQKQNIRLKNEINQVKKLSTRPGRSIQDGGELNLINENMMLSIGSENINLSPDNSSIFLKCPRPQVSSRFSIFNKTIPEDAGNDPSKDEDEDEASVGNKGTDIDLAQINRETEFKFFKSYHGNREFSSKIKVKKGIGINHSSTDPKTAIAIKINQFEFGSSIDEDIQSSQRSDVKLLKKIDCEEKIATHEISNYNRASPRQDMINPQLLSIGKLLPSQLSKAQEINDQIKNSPSLYVFY